jgi:hypothetical protein
MLECSALTRITITPQSNLSAYLHYGQLSAQRIILEAMKVRSGEFLRSSFCQKLTSSIIIAQGQGQGELRGLLRGAHRAP